MLLTSDNLFRRLNYVVESQSARNDHRVFWVIIQHAAHKKLRSRRCRPETSCNISPRELQKLILGKLVSTLVSAVSFPAWIKYIRFRYIGPLKVMLRPSTQKKFITNPCSRQLVETSPGSTPPLPKEITRTNTDYPRNDGGAAISNSASSGNYPVQLLNQVLA